MEELIAAIACANEDEIEKILRTAICRKRELYPGWDIEYHARLKGQDANLKPGKMKKTRRRLYEKRKENL
ncbi:MAG TPA: hypothetical protein DDY87_05730 [Clostridiales bacterium]|nr:hypothetical protein [Clostridiales bacterium]